MIYVAIYIGILVAFLLGYRFGLAVAWGRQSDRRYEIEEALRRWKERDL